MDHHENKPGSQPVSPSLEAYFLSEWEGYRTRPERQSASLAAVAGRRVSNVLDIGCGAGQELLPFVVTLGAAGTGVDIEPEAVRVAYRQFAELGYTEKVQFYCSQAESLPFAANSFDVVTCRLALQYTLNQIALSEIARVLRVDGLLILRIHHALYYFHTLRRAVASRDARAALWSLRVLLAGTLYHITGRQPDNRILKREVFQTRWLLSRVLSSVGLVILQAPDDSTQSPRTPTFLIERLVKGA